jgi:hypothetical protein
MLASKILGQWQYPVLSQKKVIDVVVSKSNQYSNTLKYPGVVTIRERVLGRQERKLGYRFGSTPK